MTSGSAMERRLRRVRRYGGSVTEFVLFCVPTLIYLAVQTRRKVRSFSSARAQAGLTAGTPASYAWALLLLIPLVLTGWLALTVIPSGVLAMPGVTTMQVTSVGIAVGVVLRAVGEEVLFRGLLGGVLVRRLGFGGGNLLQALQFLVPHLALLLVDPRMWPIIPVQFAAGRLLGWLRHGAGSIVPAATLASACTIAP